MMQSEQQRVAHSAQQQVTVVEVGPRDGLQFEPDFYPTKQKIALVDALSQTGLKRIEVTSFVHPKVIPNLEDALEVLLHIKKKRHVRYSALVPNLRGGQKAVQTPVDEIVLFLSASEAHNRKNVSMSIAESLKGFESVARLALKAGKTIRGYVAMALGCPFEGRIPIARIHKIIKAYQEIGVAEIALCDTNGMANPKMTAEIFKAVLDTHPTIRIAAHFHNNRGLGLANVYAALTVGVKIFDSSIGGLGGCPTALDAIGNVPTEDLVNMLEEMGCRTGVDFEKLCAASALAEKILTTPLPSYTLRSGRPKWSKQNAMPTDLS